MKNWQACLLASALYEIGFLVAAGSPRLGTAAFFCIFMASGLLGAALFYWFRNK